MAADTQETRRADEQRQVDMRRYQEAFDAGLSHEDASAFSYSGVDVGLLRRCVANRWTPEQIAAVIL